MKKLYYLLLLSLFTSFILMSNDQENKNKVLAQQLIKAKGLLAFMGLPTKEETKATAETKEEAPMTTEIESKAEAPTSTNNETIEVEYAMGKKGGLNPELTVTLQDDHIPKFTFIQKAKNILISLTNFKLNDSYELDAAIVISLFENLKLTTPLGNEIKQAVISKIPAGKTSVSTINSIVVHIASYWNDKGRLGEHYQKNEAAYSAKETTKTVKELVKELEVADLETDKNRIKNFLSNLKEHHKEIEAKKKKAEEEKKKQEEEKAAEEAQKKAEKAAEKAAEEARKKAFFIEVLRREIEQQNSELDAIAIAGDTANFDLRIVSLEKIEEKKGEVNVANGSAALAWAEIYKSVYNFVKNNATLVTVSECKNYVQSLLLEYGRPAEVDRLYEAYLLDENLSNFPSGLAGWINSSSMAANLETFIPNFKKKWKNVVYSAVDVFEADLSKKGISAKATRSAIVQNFKLILSRPLHQTAKQPGLDIASIFESYLPAGTIISFVDVNRAWKNTLDYCSEKKFLADLFEKTILKESKSLADVAAAIDSIPNVLPSVSAISTALQNSIYSPK